MTACHAGAPIAWHAGQTFLTESVQSNRTPSLVPCPFGESPSPISRLFHFPSHITPQKPRRSRWALQEKFVEEPPLPKLGSRALLACFPCSPASWDSRLGSGVRGFASFSRGRFQWRSDDDTADRRPPAREPPRPRLLDLGSDTVSGSWRPSPGWQGAARYLDLARVNGEQRGAASVDHVRVQAPPVQPTRGWRRTGGEREDRKAETQAGRSQRSKGPLSV
jgi:hypothetical protein